MAIQFSLYSSHLQREAPYMGMSTLISLALPPANQHIIPSATLYVEDGISQRYVSSGIKALAI